MDLLVQIIFVIILTIFRVSNIETMHAGPPKSGCLINYLYSHKYQLFQSTNNYKSLTYNYQRLAWNERSGKV